MMKAPLFFIATLVLTCILCSCGRTYYHSEVNFPQLKGSIVRMVDTVYLVKNQQPYDLCLAAVDQYRFDSLGRLTGEKKQLYPQHPDSACKDDGEPISICSKKHTYDLQGRRIESLQLDTFRTVDAQAVITNSMKLVKTGGNHEIWAILGSDNLYPGEMPRQKEVFYTKNTLTIVRTDEMNGDGKEISTYTYDAQNRLIEHKETVNGQPRQIVSYTYNDDGNIDSMQREFPVEGKIFFSTFHYDHIDNEGNWRKRSEYDSEGHLTNILLRSIEYR